MTEHRLVRRIRKPAHRKSKDPAAKVEGQKLMLRYFGTGIWQGDLKAMRRDRINSHQSDTK